MKHGHYKNQTPSHTYKIWMGMKQRCTSETAPNYFKYGGAGITIPKAWEDFTGFLKDMDAAPTPKSTLDRIDNKLGYSKENCRWTDIYGQARNRSNNHYLFVDGECKLIVEWAALRNLNPATVSARRAHGWTSEEAVNTPVAASHTGKRHGRKAEPLEFYLETEGTHQIYVGATVNGYGVYRGRSAHRQVYEAETGVKLTLAEDVIQTCGNHLCCNIQHLRCVARSDNANRFKKVG